MNETNLLVFCFGFFVVIAMELLLFFLFKIEICMINDNYRKVIKIIILFEQILEKLVVTFIKAFTFVFVLFLLDRKQNK